MAAVASQLCVNASCARFASMHTYLGQALINHFCAGLESVTQVFSVISSCIVDESVGRCSPSPKPMLCAGIPHCAMFPVPSMQSRAGPCSQAWPSAGATGVQLCLGHARALPSSCLIVFNIERLLAEQYLRCFATVLVAQRACPAQALAGAQLPLGHGGGAVLLPL